MAEEKTTTEASATKVPAATEGWEEISASEGEETQTAKENTETKATEAKDTTQQIADEDHPTKLGRKVKDLTETVTSLATRIDELLASAKKDGNTQSKDVSERHGDLYDQMCAIEPPPVEYVTTPKEQVLVRQWEQRVMGKIQEGNRSTFTSAYMGKMKELAEEGGELHSQIVNMITADGSPYNRVRTGQGAVDAELNYHKAHKTLLTGKEKPVTSFGKGDKAEGSGVTTPTGKEAVTVKTVKLDPLAQGFADYLNMSDEDRAEAMTRPMPGMITR